MKLDLKYIKDLHSYFKSSRLMKDILQPYSYNQFEKFLSNIIKYQSKSSSKLNLEFKFPDKLTQLGLYFKESPNTNVRVIPEIIWQLTIENDEIICGSFVIRIWSSDMNVYVGEFEDRDKIFAKMLENRNNYRISDQRVMNRFHLDLGSNIIKSEQPHPIIHLQSGGQASEIEMQKAHPSINEPRFSFLPFDVVLTLELIVLNYFQEIFNKSGTEKTKLRRLVKKSENLFISKYIEKLKSCLNGNAQKPTLYEALSNIQDLQSIYKSSS